MFSQAVKTPHDFMFNSADHFLFLVLGEALPGFLLYWRNADGRQGVGRWGGLAVLKVVITGLWGRMSSLTAPETIHREGANRRSSMTDSEHG